MVEIIDILPEKVYKFKWNQEDHLELKNDVMAMMRNKGYVKKMDYGPKNPVNIVIDHKKFNKKFLSFLNGSIDTMKKEINLKRDHFISLMWVTYRDNAKRMHDMHVHQNSLISGVYTLNIPKKMELNSIQFFAPRKQADYYRASEDMILNDHDEIKTNEAELILFRSDIAHGVASHPDSESRSTIAFNVFLKTMGDYDGLTYLNLEDAFDNE